MKKVASVLFHRWVLISIGILAFVGNRARLGRLPRTRPIVPGELAVSD